MDQHRSIEEKIQILDDLSDKLTRYGYSAIQSRSALLSGIRYHQRKVKEAGHEGRKTINRNMRSSQQRLRKLIKNKTDKVIWFKPNPDIQKKEESSRNERTRTNDSSCKFDLRKTVAVLHLPRTQEGLLLKEFSKAETQLRLVCTTKVKVKERVGNTIKYILVKIKPLVQCQLSSPLLPS